MQRDTNTKFIVRMMDQASTGPLMQAFILEAVRRYSEDIINEGIPEDNPRALISPRAWYVCAEVAQLELT